MFNGVTKYYYDINYYFLYFDFDEDWCTYWVYLTFGCTGNSITCLGITDKTLSWYGDSTTLGTRETKQVLSEEVVGATIYKNGNSPLFEGWDPAGGFQLCQKNLGCKSVGYGGSVTYTWA